jgi:hypothetical protein
LQPLQRCSGNANGFVADAWQSMCATDEGVLKGEQWCKRCIWGNLLPQWKDAFGNVDKISSKDFVSL